MMKCRVSAALLLAGFSMGAVSNGSTALPCREILTSHPPFYFTAVEKNESEDFQIDGAVIPVESQPSAGPAKGSGLTSEKFFIDRELTDSKAKAIGRGSRVRLLGNSKNAALNGESDALLKVEVLTSEARYSHFQARDSGTSFARSGDRGYVWNKSLKKAGDNDVLILKQDARLMSMSGLTSLTAAAGSALRPLMHQGKYRARRCPTGKAGVYDLSYLFSTFDSGQKAFGGEVLMPAATNACTDISLLSGEAFQKLISLQKSVENLYGPNGSVSFSELEFNDWGMARLPTKPTSNDPLGISEVALDGSFVHYQGTDPNGSDTWAEPDAICGFLRIAQGWKSACSASDQAQCTLQVGDLAFIAPVKVKNSERDPLGHKFHYSGRCFDVRPLRNDSRYEATNLTISMPYYNRALMRQFVRHLLSAGASPVYFNDPDIYGDSELGTATECDRTDSSKDKGNRVQRCPEHDNHIHFCLEPDRVKGCE